MAFLLSVYRLLLSTVLCGRMASLHTGKTQVCLRREVAAQAVSTARDCGVRVDFFIREHRQLGNTKVIVQRQFQSSCALAMYPALTKRLIVVAISSHSLMGGI